MLEQNKKAIPLGQLKIESSARAEKNTSERLIAAIGYLWILCLIPLIGKRESEFAAWHGKQGLVLTVISFAVWLLAWAPAIGWLIGSAGTIVIVFFGVTGVVNALQGKYWEMPFLGKYAKRIKI